jgi:hypothetical protein
MRRHRVANATARWSALKIKTAENERQRNKCGNIQQGMDSRGVTARQDVTAWQVMARRGVTAEIGKCNGEECIIKGKDWQMQQREGVH